PRRMGAGEAAAGLVAPLIARHRIDIDENVFGDEIRELLVAVVTQEQRLASVPDKDDRVMRNIALAHDALLRAEFRRPPPAGGFGSGTRALFDQADMRPSLRAKRSNPGQATVTSDPLDCFVASLLAMTIQSDRIPLLERYPNGLNRLGDSRNS